MASPALEDVSTHIGATSPLPFGRSADAACPVCLDLDYDLFQKTVRTKGLYVPWYWGKSRHHITKFEDIYASARAGCRLCAILHRGIPFYWGEERHTEESEAPAEKGREIEEPEDEQDQSLVKKKVDKEPRIIFLELRPGKPLSVFQSSHDPLMLFSYHTKVEFHTIPGFSPVHPAFVCAPKVPSYLNMKHCATILEDWLQRCTTHHASCLAPLPRLPRRLVRVSDHNIRLVETEDLAYAKYTTLSHCWGEGTNMIKTTKGNIKQRLSNIDWEELNQIFKDAIAITRRIGCQWIWIDSLCITQDDAVDWKRESSKMADVYSNSFLNIAATFSATSSGSCFSQRMILTRDEYDLEKGRKYLSVESSKIPDGLDGPSMGLCVRMAHQMGHLHITDSEEIQRHQASPLLDRAWVFQERLLAPRTLHFGLSEMMWECNSCLRCECEGVHDTKTLANWLKGIFADACQNHASQDKILDLWRSMVQVYTSLALTHVSDIPHAIAGIASRMSLKLASEYLAGIWTADLARGLLWYAAIDLRTYAKDRKRHSPYIPTWSWMSMYHATRPGLGVKYQMAKSTDLDARLSVQWYRSGAGEHPFGDVPYGRLEITAAAKMGTLSGVPYIQVVCEEGKERSVFLDCRAHDGLVSGMSVLCLLFGVVDQCQTVLVLKPSSESGCYTRIGLGWWQGSSFEDAEVRSVVVC